MAIREQILFFAPGGPLGRLRTRVLLSRYLQVGLDPKTRNTSEEQVTVLVQDRGSALIGCAICQGLQLL